MIDGSSTSNMMIVLFLLIYNEFEVLLVVVATITYHEQKHNKNTE